MSKTHRFEMFRIRKRPILSTPPEEFRGYLAGVHAVNGPDIPDRPNHSLFTDACRQDGLADAAKNIFDKHSFASQAPLTFEHRCSSWLGFALSRAIDKRHEDLYVARDITARTQAAFVQVQGQRQQAELELGEVEKQIEHMNAVFKDPRHPLYEPFADVLSTPDLEKEEGSAKGRRTRTRPWAHMIGTFGSWIWGHPWKKIVLWLALVGGEVGLIWGVTQQIGDDELTGLLLAISLSAMAVGIAWMAVPPLLDPATSRRRKAVSCIALALYVTTMLALGWLRYVLSRPDVLDLYKEAMEQPALPWQGDVLLYSLWVALPLGLTAVIALLETHRSTDRQASGADRLVSVAAGAENLDHQPGEGTLGADRHLKHRQDQLIHHLRDLRTRRRMILRDVSGLKAEEAHAEAAQEDVRLNESAIDERTRLYVQSLPELVGEGFLCYLKGLEHGMGNPTMTAHIQEVAETFLARYTETAEAKVNEYLVYLDEHPLTSKVPVTSVRGL